MTKKTVLSCFVVSLAFVGTAHAEGTFQIGPQLGWSDFDISSSVYGLGGEDDMKGATVGLLARYTVPVGRGMDGDGLFFGLEAGLAKEFASDKNTLSGSGTAGGYTFNGTITGESSAKWSADLMPRIGYKTGDVSLSLAAGLSFVQGEFGVSGSGTVTGPATGSFSGSESFSGSAKDTQWHTGWKIAPGIDYQMSENVTLFGQVHYAKYGAETYTLFGVPLKAEPEVRGVRVGVLYSF